MSSRVIRIRTYPETVWGWRRFITYLATWLLCPVRASAFLKVKSSDGSALTQSSQCLTSVPVNCHRQRRNFYPQKPCVTNTHILWLLITFSRRSYRENYFLSFYFEFDYSLICGLPSIIVICCWSHWRSGGPHLILRTWETETAVPGHVTFREWLFLRSCVSCLMLSKPPTLRAYVCPMHVSIGHPLLNTLSCPCS